MGDSQTANREVTLLLRVLIVGVIVEIVVTFGCAYVGLFKPERAFQASQAQNENTVAP